MPAPVVVVVETIQSRATRALDLGQATRHLAAGIEGCAGHIQAQWVLAAQEQAGAGVKCQVIESSASGLGTLIQARVHLSCVVEMTRADAPTHHEETTASYSVQQGALAPGSAVDPLLLQSVERGALLRALDQLACPIAAHFSTPSPRNKDAPLSHGHEKEETQPEP